MKEEQKQYKRFTKEQILSSKRYTPIQRDLLDGLLKDDKQYTIEEVARLLEKFLKQEAI